MNMQRKHFLLSFFWGVGGLLSFYPSFLTLILTYYVFFSNVLGGANLIWAILSPVQDREVFWILVPQYSEDSCFKDNGTLALS